MKESDTSVIQAEFGNIVLEAFNRLIEILENKDIDSSDPVVRAQLQELLQVLERILQRISAIKPDETASTSESSQ